MSRAVERVAAILQARAGFRDDPALHGRLTRCLHDAAEAAGQTLDDYVVALESDDDAVQRLVDRVTIQESAFFRDEAQFGALATFVLPRLEATTVWSAGCANGQEAWSLVMTLIECGRADCTVLATDISMTALARAKQGWYAPRELRGLSSARRDRFFVARDGGYEIVPELRALVNFGHHNLAADAVPSVAAGVKVAFCRNVLIYLTDDEISAVLDRLANALGPGGRLFLGYSESLWRLPSRFVLQRMGDVFAYEVDARPPARPARNAPVRRQAPARHHTTAPPVPSPSADEYIEQGKVASAAHDLAAAVVAFRKAAYLRPADPAIALQLAFTLEALGDADGARPWFRRSLETISNVEPLEPVLEGWSTTELTRILERKVAVAEP